ncbi:uncharacterized protein LOC124898523 [Capsicum annuum]|uniref:uncharacterized protein LOC124898523 n=1 Tax=Capsicum annuum TaxID=4072 RepID=UPI001FB05F69|nr:uncharacterized protein LOC124898523 [Capsicum annuum]
MAITTRSGKVLPGPSVGSAGIEDVTEENIEHEESYPVESKKLEKVIDNTPSKHRWCVLEVDMLSILEESHASPVGGHHAGDRTARKVLQSVYYWPSLFKDAYEFVKRPYGLSPKASIDEAPKLELKVLPPNFKCVYLGDNDTLPVILSAGLSDMQIKEAMKVLKIRKKGFDGIIRRYVLQAKFTQLLQKCHSSPYGGHHGGERTARKVLLSSFFWTTLFRDAEAFVKSCDQYQRLGTISRYHEMPLNNILEVEVFDVWGINFMGPFPPSNDNLYILVAVDYVSKWAKATTCPTSDTRVVLKFMKKQIFSQFRTPGALISDGETQFINTWFKNILAKYGVRHKVAAAYHPQMSGQV